LFAQWLGEREVPGGNALRALVFLVIAVTVTVHGLTGAWIANSLGLRRPAKNGFAILGANELALALARILEGDGHEVVIIDSNPDRVHHARALGLTVLLGQGLQPDILEAIDADSRLGCIGLTPNEEVNLLFTQRVREEARLPRLWVALCNDSGGVPIEAVEDSGAAVLFARPRRLEEWGDLLASGEATVEGYTRTSATTQEDVLGEDPALLVLAVRLREGLMPYDEHIPLGSRDEIVVAVLGSMREEAEAALSRHGFSLAEGRSRTNGATVAGMTQSRSDSGE
jgi:hypothetical protein